MSAKTTAKPMLELQHIGKQYGAIHALHDISFTVSSGSVTCVLGDNGAGKSTLIKIIAGLHKHDTGKLKVGGRSYQFESPREAMTQGIAVAYQDLAVVGLMPVWRNFFLGSELTKGHGIFRRLDIKRMREITRQELADMGIHLHDINQPIGQLSGGQRQCVAIARAVYFGAKILILDEPTAALGVKQSGVVLRYIVRAREKGLAVIFITHNPHHAYLIGDQFVVLQRGENIGTFMKKDITLEKLMSLMAGGAELETLSHEIEQLKKS